ncbi:unnamed protein product [Dicrocoelium dendriticum]|nr:unnamed protein product [Dicrocoelium dendriticum]
MTRNLLASNGVSRKQRSSLGPSSRQLQAFLRTSGALSISLCCKYFAVFYMLRNQWRSQRGEMRPTFFAVTEPAYHIPCRTSVV